MGNINAKDPDYWNVSDDPGIRNENWMQTLPDNMLVSQVSIPGTHNTMAREGGLWVWCQSLSLAIQLLIGIRFLDIRSRHFQDTLPIHHGVAFQNINFSEVVKKVLDFLDKHPSEFVFMRVKKEYKAERNTLSFSDIVEGVLHRAGRHRFCLNTTIPSVGECRGKVVILNDFAQNKKHLGIPWRSIDLEDTWDTDSDNKWEKVRRHLDKAQSDSGGKMYITFSSHVGSAPPRSLARTMNPRLHSYVRNAKKRIGIVASDYPGPSLITDIIKINS